MDGERPPGQPVLHEYISRGLPWVICDRSPRPLFHPDEVILLKATDGSVDRVAALYTDADCIRRTLARLAGQGRAVEAYGSNRRII